MEKIWQLYPQLGESLKNEHPDINPFILQLLYNRDIKTPEDWQWFLFPEKIDFLDPFLFVDMESAVNLTIDHVKKRNKIVIYGDYDADGVSSSALLFDILKILKAQVDFYLPDRVSEGYGLNNKAIDELKKQGASLIITVDNGIRSKNEVAYAQSLGIDVIITDHHAYPENQEDWPQCLIINPAHEVSGYPFKYLAGVGVAFKFVSALIKKAKISEELKQSLVSKNLDLVVLGTISDMVPLVGENRLIAQKGLEILNKTKNPGLLELIAVAGISSELNSFHVGFQLGPRLNAASRIKHANTALELLISQDSSKVKNLAQDLNNKNLERQKITENVLAAAESQIDKNNIPNIIVVKDFSKNPWNEGVLGLVAGRISEKYYRPVLVIVKTEEEAQANDGEKYFLYKGSGRSIEEFNLVEALDDSRDFLYKHGGHPMAGGFSILSEENTFAFIDNMLNLADKKLAKIKLAPKIKIDCELNLADINDSLVEMIESLAPFGQNNPSPKFVSYDLKIIDIFKMGSEGQHLKFKLLDPHNKNFHSFWGLIFSANERYYELNIGDNIDLVYSLEFNEFNGRRDVQLKIIDFKKKIKF